MSKNHFLSYHNIQSALSMTYDSLNYKKIMYSTE